MPLWQYCEPAEASLRVLLNASQQSGGRALITPPLPPQPPQVLSKPCAVGSVQRPCWRVLHAYVWISTPVESACEDNLYDSGAAQSFFSVNVQDEYDPARPNDYEEIRRTRERQRVDTEREAERQEELRAQKAAQEVCFYLCHTGHVLLDTSSLCFVQQHSGLSNAASVHQGP